MPSIQTVLPIVGAAIALLGLVLAFARVSPDDAKINLTRWAKSLGFVSLAGWTKKNRPDLWLVRAGAALTAMGGVVATLGGYFYHPIPIAPPETKTVSSATSPDITRQLEALQHERSVTLGRASFFTIMNGLAALPPEFKLPPKQFIIVSSPPENAVVANDLNALLYLAWNQSGTQGSILPLNMPNYERDLDAPKFDGRALPGITVHGNTPVADFIVQNLNNCFQIRRTSEMPLGVAEYYRKTNSTVVASDTFTWLEIGEGTPWKNRPCNGPGN